MCAELAAIVFAYFRRLRIVAWPLDLSAGQAKVPRRALSVVIGQPTNWDWRFG